MSNEPTVIGGRYELGELLGRGGMAEVRKGRDTRLGPHRGRQAAAHRPGQRRHLPGAVPPGGAELRLAQPPLDRVGLRHRRGDGHRRLRRRPALHRHGVRAGPDPARHPARGPQDPARARARDHQRRARRPRLQPPRRDHPPRHQARQRDADAQRRRQGDGLRHRPGRLRRLLDDDPDGRGRRHRAVPLPRAGPRRDRRLPLGRLLHRLPALRAPHRPPALRRRQPGRGGLPARARAALAPVGPRPGARPGDRRDRAEVAGQAGRGPLPERGRDAPGHRALPRRPPDPGGPAAGRGHRGRPRGRRRHHDAAGRDRPGRPATTTSAAAPG